MFTFYTVNSKQVAKSYKKRSLLEAFYTGMQINYRLQYPDGSLKIVEFKNTPMQSLVEINTNIAQVKKQMSFLDVDPKISKKDKIDISEYYKLQLQILTKKKEKINAPQS